MKTELGTFSVVQTFSTVAEAAYLFGAGGQNWLRINMNSVVVLYGIEAYVFQTAGAQQVHLNSLFPVGVTQIAYDQGFLQLCDIINGDFDGDGFVDAGDYVWWRKTLNQSGPNLRADDNHDGSVTQLDYNVWRANFGNSVLDVVPGSGTGVGAIAEVPEPSMLVLVLAGIVAASTFRKR